MASEAITVLHVVNTLEGGGLERQLIAQLNWVTQGASPASHQPELRHVVVTLREPGPLATQLPASVPCIPLCSKNNSPRTPFAMARLIRRFTPAVMHARGVGCWFDATAASALVAPSGCVLSFHGRETGRPFSVRHRAMVGAARARGARLVSVSHAGANQLQRELHLPDHQIDVLPNGVDLNRFSNVAPDARAQTRSGLNIRPDAFVVITVGSLTPVKRHDLLLTAAEHLSAVLPDLVILIAGDGPLRPHLEERAAATGLAEKVRFLGQREDMTALLSAADLFVCPSDSEGMSNAILEAMAAGLPLVATHVGDNPTLIRHKLEGLIVPPDAPDALSDAIHELGAGPNVRSRMAAAARTRAADFSLDRTAAAYMTYYRNLASREEASQTPRDLAALHFRSYAEHIRG